MEAKMAEICGAKTRSGAKCKSRPMANGRCRMHGGKSTGAPKSNTNAATHGIYQQHLTPDEQSQYNALELGRVDHELRLMRIRMARALAAETAANNKPELVEIIEREGAENATARHEEKYKQRDFVAIIDKIAARIESLERTRKTLMADDGESGGFDDITRDDTTIRPDEAIPKKPIL